MFWLFIVTNFLLHFKHFNIYGYMLTLPCLTFSVTRLYVTINLSCYTILAYTWNHRKSSRTWTLYNRIVLWQWKASITRRISTWHCVRSHWPRKGIWLWRNLLYMSIRLLTVVCDALACPFIKTLKDTLVTMAGGQIHWKQSCIPWK